MKIEHTVETAYKVKLTFPALLPITHTSPTWRVMELIESDTLCTTDYKDGGVAGIIDLTEDQSKTEAVAFALKCTLHGIAKEILESYPWTAEESAYLQQLAEATKP